MRSLGGALVSLLLFFAACSDSTPSTNKGLNTGRPSPGATSTDEATPPSVPKPEAVAFSSTAPARNISPPPLYKDGPGWKGYDLPPFCGFLPDRMTPPQWMSVTVDVPPLTQRDREVEMTIRVRNDGPAPVNNRRANGEEHDLWITNSSGAIVWRAARGKMYVQIVTGETFLPFQEVTRVVRWDHGMCPPYGSTATSKIPPGRYAAQALWRTWDESSGKSGAWYSDPVPLVIE